MIPESTEFDNDLTMNSEKLNGDELPSMVFEVDDTGIAVFPSADAIQMLINGALGGVLPRGNLIPGVVPPGAPPQIAAIYKTASGVIIGIRSKFGW